MTDVLCLSISNGTALMFYPNHQSRLYQCRLPICFTQRQPLMALLIVYLKTDGATQMGGDVTDHSGTKTNLDDRNDEASPAGPVF